MISLASSASRRWKPAEVWVIRDGKVAFYAWTLTEDSTMRLKAALAEAMPEEPAPEPVAETPVSEITVTFADGTCLYDGPLTLQSGQIQVTVDVLDEDKTLYALTFFTLDPDKRLHGSDGLDGCCRTARLGGDDLAA